MKTVQINLRRFIAVAIVGGIVMAIGEPFVADDYQRAFFIACGGALGVATMVLAVRPKPDAP
jgi:hypothetical protein